MTANVLLIDDDVDLCKVMSLALTKLGFEVETAYARYGWLAGMRAIS